ncbi:type VI secretion system ATPase TssH [Azoarcus indigens]|uniref:Type VI secretion system protein VasG n=1 Tax=Azoarcus indigens TaxID=29545 RepID=A0A4V6PQI5_9RHOO|nr:type VI secretion system ATPase TssH [Azoarcus indigens]TDN47262.1 type VI secretion system protein VasG [Azoarcus indigens]
MLVVDLPALLERLNPFCRQALESAGASCMSQRGDEVTVAHLLSALLEQPRCDVSTVLAAAGLDAEDVKQALAGALPGPGGALGAYPAFSPLLVELVEEAWLLSSVEFAQASIRSGALLLAMLLKPVRYLPMAVVQVLDAVNRETLRKQFSTLLSASAEALAAVETTADRPCRREGEGALGRYGHDFTAQARHGRIDPVLCRDREIDLMIDILSRRRKNNPIVVGDAGVGKSAVVEGLALRVTQGRVPLALRGIQLWGLDLGALQAGASVKGEFEKRLKAVIDEVKDAPQPIILFIDEAHTLIGAGNAAGGSDAANLLKPALARGELRTIAATTWSEYKKYFEKDPALTRRFQLVKLDEPTPEQTVHILRGLRPVYEREHQVYIGEDALQAAATLAARYLSGRQLPDKAIDVLDTACARVATALAEPPRRLAALENRLREIEAEVTHLERDQGAGRKVTAGRLDTLVQDKQRVLREVAGVEEAWRRQRVLVDEILALRAEETRQGPAIATRVAALEALQREDALLHADVGAGQIAQVIADWTGIPAATISSDQMTRLERLPVTLCERVKGQEAALAQLHRHLLTAMADLRRPDVPLGAFLLVGPSGVGKTETALAVAEALFGGERFLTTINMSEYQERHTVSRLQGAPPGYVGYGEGGVLTEAIRKQPYSVVLLDEVEKAHPEVLNLFYQVFDKGMLTDGEGRRIDCRNILFFLTSNLGFDHGSEGLADIGLEELRERLMRFFKPALLARMQLVPYRYLGEEVLAEIVDSRLQRLQRQFIQRYDAVLDIGDCARGELRARCTRHLHGARMLDASLDGELMPPLSLAVLQSLAAGKAFSQARLSWEGGRFAAVIE